MSIEMKSRIHLNSGNGHAKGLDQPVVLLQGLLVESFFDFIKKRDIKMAVVLEGRPRLKAVKSNTDKLLKNGIIPLVIADNMAGYFFYKNLVKEVWIGYQSKSKETLVGETGALILGVLGKRHKVPVNAYPAQGIREFIGQESELLSFNGKQVTSQKLRCYVPLLEIVPRKYIEKIF